MQSELFVQEVSRRLRNLFSNSKLGMKIPAIERHRLEGFMQAGIFLGISSNAELAELMGGIHIEIFGKTIAERKAETPSSWVFEEVDYSMYETPAYGRTR